jgi:hypothetical protein
MAERFFYKLTVSLLMTILTQSFLSFMRRHFMTFSFFTAGHSIVLRKLKNITKIKLFQK